MQRFALTLGLAGLVLAIGCAVGTGAQPDAPAVGDGADGPRYENGTHLLFPADYRTWTFLSSGLGMTYEGEGGTPGPQSFGNVFVNPSSHRRFLETGAWPDGTTFVLEFRRSASEGSINQAGRFQTDLVLVEAEVKDSRFDDGWAFYQFGQAGALRDVAPPMSGDPVQRCIECHTEHAAVERTFVQFYPTLLEVAREKGTLKPGF